MIVIGWVFAFIRNMYGIGTKYKIGEKAYSKNCGKEMITKEMLIIKVLMPIKEMIAEYTQPGAYAFQGQ